MNLKELFVEFVNSQPDDKEIDHLGGWDTCAVGDFAQKMNMEPRRAAVVLFSIIGTYCFNLANYYFLETNIVVPVVNDRTIMDDLNMGKFDTYGQLKKQLS